MTVSESSKPQSNDFGETNPDSPNSTASCHPNRYAGTGGIECIDAIHAALGDEGFESFCVGQCMRYLWRYKRKNGSNDLHKAADYLGWATKTRETIEGNAESDDGNPAPDDSCCCNPCDNRCEHDCDCLSDSCFVNVFDDFTSPTG